MRPYLSSVCVLLVLCACQRSPTPSRLPKPDSQPSIIEAADLLTSAEVQAVQGEPVVNKKATVRKESGFVISQCYFALSTASKSITLTVTQRGDLPNARDPREFWNQRFHENGDVESEGEKEGRPTTPPQKIGQVGEEAYWTGTEISGALYVLQGDKFLRVAAGSGNDASTRLERSKALARRALKRM
jgi:hypothetical protein